MQVYKIKCEHGILQMDNGFFSMFVLYSCLRRNSELNILDSFIITLLQIFIVFIIQQESKSSLSIKIVLKIQNTIYIKNIGCWSRVFNIDNVDISVCRFVKDLSQKLHYLVYAGSRRNGNECRCEFVKRLLFELFLTKSFFCSMRVFLNHRKFVDYLSCTKQFTKQP